MAVTNEQKIDFLLKKIGFTKTKTGSVVGTGAISGTPKQPFAEAIPSPLVVPNSSLWNEAGSIPATPPGSDTAQVKVYLAASSGLRMTADATSSGQRAYIAYTTYNDTSSARLTNWIDTQFGASYLIKVYKGDPNSGGVALSAAGSGANDGWFFDYSAGVLNFNDTIVPSGVTDTNIYIVGYRYIGQTGAPTSGISTFSNLDLTVERNLDVGKQGGISTFRHNVQLLDNTQLTLGTGNDIQLYWNGSQGFITNQGGSNLHLNSDSTLLKNAANTKSYIRAYNNSSVEIFYNNNKKFETTVSGINVTGDGVFSGNVSIGGTLTYEDVKNVDAVGLITARSGIRVTGGVIEAQAGENKIPSLYAAMGNLPSAGSYHGMFAHVHATGRGYFAHAGNWYELVNKEVNGVVGTGTETYNIGDLDVDGHTELDNVNVSGIITSAAARVNGATILNGNVDFYGSNYGIAWNKAAGRLGFLDNATLSFGNGFDTQIKHNNSHLIITNTTGNIDVTGNVLLNNDLDVDGHTNLDNVSIAGFTTITQDLDVDGSIGVGIANPSQKIHIDGGNLLISNSTQSGSSAPQIRLNSSSSDGSSTRFMFGLATGSNHFINGSASNDSCFSAPSNMLFGIGNTRKFRIKTTDVLTDIDFIPSADDATSLGRSNARWSDLYSVDANISGDLDVDGHTNLDNVSVAGVTTFTGTAEFDGTAKFDSTITAGGVTGNNGQYLKSTASGVAWASFPSLRTKQTFTASSGQTTFSFSYTVGFLDVFINGVKLTDSEFTASNGSSIVLAVGCFVGDIVEVVGYNTVSNSGDAYGIGNLVEDLSPQLGGDLDLFNKSITGTGNVNITGIISATTFKGPSGVTATFVGDGSGLTGITASGSGVVIKDSGSVVGTAGTIDFGSNLSVSPASAGIVTITATGGGGGSGISTISGVVNIANDLNVDGHTNLDNVSISGVTTFANSVHAQTINATTFAGNGDFVELDVDGHTNLDNVSVAGVSTFTGIINVASGDIRSNTLTLKNAAGSATYATFSNGGAATLNWNNTQRLATSNAGITVTGTVAATSYTGDGSQLTGIVAGISTISGVVNIANDLDVDGHTNLDNASIAGVVTATTIKSSNVDIDGGSIDNTNIGFNVTANALFGNVTVNQLHTVNGAIDLNGDLDVDGHTNLDNVSVAGVVTATTFSGAFIGNGSGLTGVVASGAGFIVKDDGSTVGTAGTVNFTEPITVTPLSAGITTVGINTSQFNLERLNVSGISTFQNASSYSFTVGAGNLTVGGNAIYGSSKLMFLGGGGGDMAYYSGGSSYSDHIFRTLQGGSQIERFRINSSAAISVAGSYGNAGQVLTSNGSGSATTWTTISGGGGADVGITTNLSGTFTASAGTPSTINTFTGYSSDDLVVEYTIYIKNGSDFQTQKLLAMRDGTTIHSTQFAVMFSSSLLVQCDATISSGNILLRATPETGVSGSTTYKIKREVM